MANDYFQFKEFIIYQDKAAMKVCTDSCIFGAYVAFKNPKKILDIGTGTGLLAIMLAQRLAGSIDAVEINKLAAKQAKENANASPWSSRINIYQNSIQEFSKTSNQLYDLIICNPPFFTNNYLSKDKDRNLAIHNDDTLSNHELLQCINKLLSEKGHFFIMLPPHQAKIFEQDAIEYNLFPHSILTINDNQNSKVLRLIVNFQNKKGTKITKCLNIKKNNVDYSEAFTHLLKPYYLNL